MDQLLNPVQKLKRNKISSESPGFASLLYLVAENKLKQLTSYYHKTFSQIDNSH